MKAVGTRIRDDCYSLVTEMKQVQVGAVFTHVVLYFILFVICSAVALFDETFVMSFYL